MQKIEGGHMSRYQFMLNPNILLFNCVVQKGKQKGEMLKEKESTERKMSSREPRGGRKAVSASLRETVTVFASWIRVIFTFLNCCLKHITSFSLPSLLLRAATDHNVDNTTAILKEWLSVMQKSYHYVEWRPMDQPTWVQIHLRLCMLYWSNVANSVLISVEFSPGWIKSQSDFSFIFILRANKGIS